MVALLGHALANKNLRPYFYMNFRDWILCTLVPGAFVGGYNAKEWWLEHTNSKVLVEGSYVLKADIDSKFISNDEVTKNYLSKGLVEKTYVPIDTYTKLESEQKILLKKVADADNAITNDSRLLAEGEAWKSTNPDFYIEFNQVEYHMQQVVALVGTSFLDGKGAWSRLDKIGDSREWKFRHNGKLYKLTAKYTKSKDRFFVETVLTDKI
ncbi:hypothetical protein [Pseudomonas sp. NPDC087614]|uniref:hypothetical protein n=1 Tax=Pseudomonas sp. NPDC087614 TaxID=3364442 RepID=UPI00382C8685